MLQLLQQVLERQPQILRPFRVGQVAQGGDAVADRLAVAVAEQVLVRRLRRAARHAGHRFEGQDDLPEISFEEELALNFGNNIFDSSYIEQAMSVKMRPAAGKMGKASKLPGIK